MLISKVALFLFVTITGHVIAESVTKCGNYGDSSYYNSTTLPYVCEWAFRMMWGGTPLGLHLTIDSVYNNPWGNDGSGYSCITVSLQSSSWGAHNPGPH
jgi:hypothetical protein